LVAHLPHWPAIDVPVRKQKGLVAVGQGSVEALPLSPLQATQVDVLVLQIGVAPLHCELLVHWTQLPVLVLQTGIAPEQSESIAHPTHTPVVAPVLPHFCERQTESPLPELQGPSPLA
jgi:hypothetical protein